MGHDVRRSVSVEERLNRAEEKRRDESGVIFVEYKRVATVSGATENGSRTHQAFGHDEAGFQAAIGIADSHR